ncbi:VRR-NUC domain-containing protein [Streptococcus dysgalactiae subsp. dysgalactiae]|uniref:VRR-NUC domain-containing protein n=1 Tax=Streptococcus dysgalactiae TaxID=1334 RepID=UPI001CF3F6B4|nr:VRR-NUC domain-containing protein [Streptococcus dysgalactiae]MCB2832752.1 VRR-NUC domain-containing protein [Streptococcus dysgalactiae subsp. dysgalactiae]
MNQQNEKSATSLSEHDIQNLIRIELSKTGHTVFRINVGKVKMQNGRWFETGVPKGYCDLSGFRKGDAKAFFIEVKNETGRVRPEQKKFMEVMASRGALVGVARSVEDALKIVNDTSR